MLNKVDILIYNIIAFICFAIVIFFQVQEAIAHVDKFGNLFN